MRLMSTVCAIAIAATAFAASSDAFAQRRGQGASVVVLDYQRVLSESSLGRDLATKLNQVRAQVSGEAQALQPEAQSIEQEARRLQNSLRNLNAQQLSNNSEVQALSQRQQQLNARAAGLQGDLECTQLIALRDVRNQVDPVIRGVMQQRNAALVIDSSQAIVAADTVDITAAVIQQLDQNAATRTANVSRRPVSECAPQQPAAQ